MLYAHTALFVDVSQSVLGQNVFQIKSFIHPHKLQLSFYSDNKPLYILISIKHIFRTFFPSKIQTLICNLHIIRRDYYYVRSWVYVDVAIFTRSGRSDIRLRRSYGKTRSLHEEEYRKSVGLVQIIGLIRIWNRFFHTIFIRGVTENV